MGLREASASHGQDEQGVEDVRDIPAGCEQDKQDVKDVRQVPAGHRQDNQGPGGTRLVVQCALASLKLYKKQGGKDDFLFFL